MSFQAYFESQGVKIAECVTPAIAQLVTPPPDEVTLASTSTHLIFAIILSIFSSPLLRHARYLPNICNALAYLPKLLLLRDGLPIFLAHWR